MTAHEATAPRIDRHQLRGHDIVCISSIDWEFIWQGHQEIMSRLAEQGNHVLFIENTGIRAAGLRDLPRLRRRWSNWLRSVRGFHKERENLYVYSPLILPFPYSWVARRVNRWLMVRDLNRWMSVLGFSRPIVWTFLPTPLARDLIRSLHPALVVYYCIDSFVESSRSARKVAQAEQRMLAEADLVFVTSDKLYQAAVCHNQRVHWFPFGVNLELFERAREAGDLLPEDLAAIPAPRIGYVGGIHQWVDQALLRELGGRYPELHFVFVGPLQTDIKALQGLRNMHFLGAKPHTEVARYVRGFDVAMIPYRLTPYTEHVYPTKTNEYLAMGKPVVSTPLREIQRFNARHGDIVSVAKTAEEFGTNISACLANGNASVARRFHVAQENSWEARLARMSEVITEALDQATETRSQWWKEVFLRLSKRFQRRLVWTSAGLAVIMGLLFYSPLPWVIGAPLKMTEAPKPADTILVLAGGVGESGKAGEGYEERVNYAVQLYRQGYAPEVIMSSGYVFIFQEAQVMKALAVSLGVPEDAILVETGARNTYENICNAAALLRSRGQHNALLISSPYHMRRAMLVARGQAPDLTFIPAPIPHSDFYGDGRHVEWRHLRALFHEYSAIAYYWWRGYLRPQPFGHTGRAHGA